MKKTSIYIFLLLVVACTRTDTFKISGILENTDSDKIYLDEQEIEKIQPLDSVRISKKGKFTFKGHTSYPRFYHMHLGNNRILPLLIGPGEKVFIRSTKQDFPYRYEIEGSEGSQYIKDLNDRLFLTRRKLDSIRSLIKNTSPLDEIRQSILSEEYNRVVEDQRNFSLKFILDHLTSMASIYAIYQELDNDTYVLYKNRDIQILKITGAALDTIYPESGHVKSLVANAANLERQIHALDIQRLINETESTLPEIALPDPDGDTILLSSLKGKVVLLSFWASWDKKSKDYNPQLIEIYKRYHRSGFEIYQVSLDNNRESWIQAVEYDELPWISVSDLSYPESLAAAIYNVTSLPMTYLINKKGDISGKNLSIDDINRRIGFLINE
jgi:thiol-disulfide isomerase/thioredoxin